MAPQYREAFEHAMAGMACHYLGAVDAAPSLHLRRTGETLLKLPLQQLKAAWQAPLRAF